MENHHHRSEYLLDYLTHLNEALKGRFKDAYKFLDQLFQDHQSVGALTISFIVETGAGINCGNGLFHKKFSDYGITDYQIQFDPSKSEDRHRAIQSILFYTSLDPRIMAVLQEGRLDGMGKTVRSGPIFLGFARGKIYDASYIRTSSQAKAFDGPSWWGEDSAEFQRILKEFNGDPQDSEHYPGIFKVSDFVDITVFTNKGIDLERAIFVFEHLALFFFKFTKTEYKQYKFESNLIEDLTDERHFTLKTMTE